MKTLIINIDKESTLERFLMLAKKLHIKTKLVDSVKKTEPDKEHDEWLKTAMLSFNDTYPNDEPNIEQIQVKEPNPNYKVWK